MRILLALTACAFGLAAAAPSFANAATYTVAPLKKAQKIGQTYPAMLSDSGVVLGTVGITGVGTLGVETNPAFASTADHCGLSGAADNTTITGASAYSIQEFIVGSCAQDVAYLFDVQHNTTSFVSYPNSLETTLTGSTSDGLAVGTYLDANDVFHGLMYFQGHYTSLDAPGSFGTFVNGINEFNEMYGSFKTVSQGDNTSGFLILDFGAYTVIDVPNAFSTEITGLNGSNQAVGGYYPNVNGSSERAFTWQNGAFTLFPLNVKSSVATAINEAGAVAGWYIDLAGKEHGFVWKPATGAVLTVDGPVNTKFIHLTAINNNGSEVTGYYHAGQKTTGFTATCSGTGCF